MNQKEWFDQFPALAEDVEWLADSQWCARHWAPCPVLHANGIGASIELMEIYLKEIKPEKMTSSASINAHIAQISPICCRLGDDRMFDLWGCWGP